MDDLLKRLESQIKNLVERQVDLKQTNQQLSNSSGTLSREKDLLVARQQKAITQIESLVSKLRAIEKIS